MTPWLPRHAEYAIVTAGALLAAAGLGWLLTTSVPNAKQLSTSTWMVALGAAAMTFAIPPLQLSNVRRARLLSAVAAMVLVFIVGLQPLAKMRLDRTLAEGSADERSAAVAELLRHGHHDFTGIDLSGAALGPLDLSGAELSQANLDRTELSGAALMEAELRGASVDQAVLRGADLTGSTIAEASGWEHTICDEETDMPDGWHCLNESPAKADRVPRKVAPGQIVPGINVQANTTSAIGPKTTRPR